MEIGLITGNEGKVREISKRLEDLDIGMIKVDGEFIEVQADSLEEVILKGMEFYTREHGSERWLMKDDSGLFIDPLDGFPGVYSAFANKTIDNDGILSLMKGLDNRKAVFRTVIGLHIPGEGLSLFRGECHGSISLEKRGASGFGFDPIFIPEGHDRTFAEMELDEKNSMSHRIRAVEKMVEYLSTRN